MKPGDRVVIAHGAASWGRRGVIVEFNTPTKPYGKRTTIRGDDGERYYFQDYQANAFFLEDSPDGAATLAKYEAALGPVDLAADVAFVASITATKDSRLSSQALDRIVRHGPAGIEALLDLAAYDLQQTSAMGKPPGWIPPSLRALGTTSLPATIARVRKWWMDPTTRVVASTVLATLGSDPSVVELLRELCAITPEADRKQHVFERLLLARLAAGDPSVYRDLADLVVRKRDGEHWSIGAGAFSPAEAEDVLRAIPDRTVDQIDVQSGAKNAYNGFDLARWLAWPGLVRFPRVVLSQAFTGTPPLEDVLASPHLSPEIQHLDFSACDLGVTACRLLGKSDRLATLRSLVLDRGDYDRSKFDRKCLEALFPKKGGTLARLGHLSIRRATLTTNEVREVVTVRAPALRTVQLEREIVEIAR